MRNQAEWRAALSMLSAMAGMGLATGREPALFFAQLGGAAWPGILAASVLFGLLAGGVIRRGHPGPGGDKLAALCAMLRLLLAALVSAIMLARLGRLGEMTLPISHSYAVGVLIGLLACLALSGLDGWWKPGLAVAIGIGVFCAANALDPRPVMTCVRGYTEFELAGNLPAAMLLASAYAFLNASVAAWGLARLPYGTVRPMGLAIRAAGLLCALLCLANLALLRGGDTVIAHPMPWVVLSARWGIVGFWICVGLQALCAAATLSAAVGVLIRGIFNSRSGRVPAVCALAVGVILFGILSVRRV